MRRPTIFFISNAGLALADAFMKSLKAGKGLNKIKIRDGEPDISK